MSERIFALRRLAMELIMSEHPEDCSSCPKYGNCILQSVFQYIGAGNGRFRPTEKLISPANGNPLFVHDFYRCIKCGRCVRVCRDVRGVGALGYYRDVDGDVVVGTKGRMLKDLDCRFCGACAEICPTGAIRDKEGLIDKAKPKEQSYVPCRSCCPAHVDIPKYVRAIREGRIDEAVRVIGEKVMLPLTLGHVCTHACESVCRRGEVDAPVSICSLKLVSSKAIDWRQTASFNPETGRKVAVIGSGPAGLAAALRLREYGNEVTVFERLPEAGGMLRYGIPEFRLPPEVLGSEIKAISDAGVLIKTNACVPRPQELLEEGFDAVLVAVGTHDGIVLPIPGKDRSGVLRNIDLLRKVRMGEKVEIGRRIAVLGGGSVAFDCALTCRRLGAEELVVICVEGRNAMRATKEEIDEAEKEGIRIINEHTFIAIEGEDVVTGIRIAPVSGISKTEDGRMVIEADTEKATVIDADTIVFAVGQRPEGTEDMGLELTRGCYIATHDGSKTSVDGVFSAGDVVTGTKSVVEAIVSGKDAADDIASFLGNGRLDERIVSQTRDQRLGRMEGFAELKRVPLSDCSERCAFEMESARCLQCDLRLDIETQRFWTDFKKGRAK